MLAGGIPCTIASQRWIRTWKSRTEIDGGEGGGEHPAGDGCAMEYRRERGVARRPQSDLFTCIPNRRSREASLWGIPCTTRPGPMRRPGIGAFAEQGSRGGRGKTQPRRPVGIGYPGPRAVAHCRRQQFLVPRTGCSVRAARLTSEARDQGQGNAHWGELRHRPRSGLRRGRRLGLHRGRLGGRGRGRRLGFRRWSGR